MRESAVLKHLKRKVASIGGIVRRVGWLGRNGAPDVRVMTPYGRLWVETKRPKGVAEGHQIREHDEMRSFGEDVRVIDTIEKVDAMIDELLSRGVQNYYCGDLS